MTKDIIQRSDDWYKARCGSLGASQLNEALATTKGGWGASRETIKNKIIAERLTGIPSDNYVNAAMQFGIDNEDAARKAYEAYAGVFVDEMGIAKHPVLLHTHASPDGLVGEDGLIEIKVPNTTTHIETLKSQKVPSKYMNQMLWQMRCIDRQWCDYVSFDPRLPEHLQLFVKRVERDDAAIAELEAKVAEFLTEVEGEIEELNRRFSDDAE
jgi:putative phage-type endonuclease